MQNFEKKNTVESKNQVNKYVYFYGSQNTGLRIMFVGNSITHHGRKDEIGWYGEWGMAASCKENDYVHIVMDTVKKKCADASFCVVQGAVWERSYENCNFDLYFSKAKNFNPDIIISFVSENITPDTFNEETFVAGITAFHEYLSGNNKNVRIICLSNFFASGEKNAAIKKYTENSGAYYVEISGLIKDDIYLAKDKFEHKGIQIHPGDEGMKEIAARILRVLCEML